MHKYLVYAAFGWLSVMGVVHFSIDVVSHMVRGKHAPGPETTLYYGLHSAYALGQVAFGLLGLYIAARALPLLTSTPVMALAALAALGWLAISFLFISYWEPKFIMGVFCVLLAAAFLTR